MAELTTPTAPGLRPLCPDLDLYSPSQPRPHAPPLPSFHHHLTVPRVRRGPMYSAYSELREARLRKKKKEGPVATATKTPEKKAAATKTRSPLVARSVPDFSAALRKENRNPGWGSPAPPTKGTKASATPPRPPPPVLASTASSKGSMPRRAGNTSANRGEEMRCGGGLFTVRKSYSCQKELKRLSGTASSAIDEEGRSAIGGGGRIVTRLSQRY